MPDRTHGDAALNAARRARDLAAATADDTVDLVVIGGGFTGVGVALDAVTRDSAWSSSNAVTSPRARAAESSKLAHGGLRYLAKLDFSIAWESALERGRLMGRIAPHLIRPLPLVMPLHSGVGRLDAAMFGIGFFAGDVLRRLARTPASLLPRPSRVSAAAVREQVPAADAEGLRGGLLSWDGQLIDDARLVVALARTAAVHGARIITYAEATDIEPGQVGFVDELTGDRHTVRAKQIVNATGVWADTLADEVELAPSKGSHLLVRAERLGDPEVAITAPVPGHFGRFVFAVPWHEGLVMVGLTDSPHHGAVPDRAMPDDEDLDFLLATINTALAEPLALDDIVGSYAGFRPLLKTSGSSSADLSRRHALLRDPRTDALTIVGGKLTEYRRMAEDAVDAVVEGGGLHGRGRVGRSRSDSSASAPPIRTCRTLVRRYGTDAASVAAYAESDPTLGGPVRTASPTAAPRSASPSTTNWPSPSTMSSTAVRGGGSSRPTAPISPLPFAGWHPNSIVNTQEEG